MLAWCWPLVNPCGSRSGDGPRSGSAAESEGGQAEQVEPGDTVVQPQVVVLGASEAQAPLAAGDRPGDRAFDHRPVLAVARLELRIAGGFGRGESANRHRQ